MNKQINLEPVNRVPMNKLRKHSTNSRYDGEGEIFMPRNMNNIKQNQVIT